MAFRKTLNSSDLSDDVDNLENIPLEIDSLLGESEENTQEVSIGSNHSPSLIRRQLAKLHAKWRASLQSEVLPESQLTLRSRVIYPALIESAIMIGWAIPAVYCTTNNAPFQNLLTLSASLSLLNNLTRLVSRDSNEETHLENRRVARWVRSFCFGASDVATRGLLMHEGAHALTALLLYQNPEPRITIQRDGWLEYTGLTHFNSGHLNTLGQNLGVVTSSGLVSAAGVASTMLTNYLSLAVAQALPDYPEVRSHLYSSVFINFLGIVSYAYMKPIPGDDFATVEKDEPLLTPTFGVLLMGVSLLFLQLILSKLSDVLAPRVNPAVRMFTPIGTNAFSSMRSSGEIQEISEDESENEADIEMPSSPNRSL